MNKFNKVLSLSFLAAAAASLAVGGVSLCSPKITAQAAFSEQQIANALPEFFDTSSLEKNDTYFSKDITLKFDTQNTYFGELQETDGTTTPLYNFYLPQEINKYDYLEITTLSFRLNGKPLSGGANLNDLILNSTQPTKFDGGNFHPQTLNMLVKYDPSLGAGNYKVTKPKVTIVTEKETTRLEIKPAVLEIGETGHLEMSLQYNRYSVEKIPSPSEPNTYSEKALSVSTNNPITFGAYLLDTNDYFETADKLAPKIRYSSDVLQRTPSDASSTHRYNYFFNYQDASLPYISIDPNQVRVTVTKSYNNSTSSETIIYDPDTKTAKAPSFVHDLVLTGDEMRIYLNDVGAYNFDFDLIYTYSVTNTQTQQTSFYVCDIDDMGVLDQRAYLFGQQMQYTDYSDNSYKEFKVIEEDFSISESANVTNLKSEQVSKELFKDWLLKNKTPVSTNQTPIKLVNNSSISSITLWKLNDGVWKKDPISDFNVTTNISDPGTYFLETTYNFASFTNASGSQDTETTFNEYFYFKIEKTTPEFKVFAQEGKNESGEPVYCESELYSGKFTNAGSVKIEFPSFGSTFNSDVRFKLVRKNFDGAVVSEREIMTASGEEIVTDEGSYTIYVYYGKQDLQEKPIERRFVIDRQAISGLSAYSVNGSRIVTPISGSTNQPFAFAWDNVKPSGAKTFGYYKYFSLEYLDYYAGLSELDLGTLLLQQLNNHNMLSADRQLMLLGGSWINYLNSQSFLGGSNLPSNRIKESAGLYVFEVFDEAGNSATEIILLDDAKPVFALSVAGEGLGLISTHHTLTSDATLRWAQNKAILIKGELDSENLFLNKNGDADESLQKAFEKFKRSIISVNDLSLSAKNGNYYLVAIDGTYGYKDRSSDNTVLENGFEKVLTFSYSVHYTLNGSSPVFYFSTTQHELSQPLYLKVGTNELVRKDVIENAEGNLFEAKVYSLSENAAKTYYYAAAGSTTLTSLSGQIVNGTLQDGKMTINGKALSDERFVDMEGDYNFLIRDASNTEGLSLSPLQRFLNYASAYEYIKVSSDDSRTQVFFTEEGKNVELSSASYSVSGTEEGNIDHTFRKSFYNPTSLNSVLKIGFIPTNTTTSGVTQVDKVSLEFYPFETKVAANLNANNSPNLAFYSSIASTPLFTTEIYNFERDGAFEGELIKDINISSGITTAGKYVITREYKLNEKEGDNYTVDVFDYYQRTLTVFVDRNGVISSPSPISYEAEIRKFEIPDKTITVTQYENILEFACKDGSLDFPNYVLKVDGEIVDSTLAKDNYETHKRYYVFNAIGEYEIFDFSENRVEPTEVYKTTIGPSLESLVGGDIFVSMYDGVAAGSGVISVTFPYYNNLLPSGDNFFTDDKDNWDVENISSDTPSTKLTTNKLPVKLFVPAVKYTMFNKETKTGANDDILSYETIFNNSLTYFDEDNTGSIISHYSLDAQINFTATDGKSEKYISNGSQNGFLNFYDDQGKLIENIYKPGTYVVTITQAMNADGNSSNNFRKNYRFSFEILSEAPEFELASSGRPLKSLDGGETYFTNAKSTTMSWQDVDDRHIANIDKANITLSTQGMSAAISIDEKTGEITVNDNSLTNEQKNNLKAALSYQKQDKVNRLTFNFDKFGNYANGQRLSITMQFEGHSNEYYSVTTKSVVIDKEAEHQTLDGLIEKVSAFSHEAMALNENSLRTYLDVEGQNVASASEAAYNTSVKVGELKHYTYQVREDFFTSLRDRASENANLGAGYNGEVIGAYYRAVANPFATDFVETEYFSFAASAFNNMNDDLDISPRTYYEIVEQDLAGNLTIYLVYFEEEDNGAGFSVLDIVDGVETEKTVYQGVQLIDDENEKRLSDAQILTNKSKLFASKSARLDSINILGDRWARVTIGSSEYMFSPWLEEGVIFRLSGNQVERFSLANVLSQIASTSAINIRISDRHSGNFCAASLTLLDGAELNTSISSTQTEEFIKIDYSNNVFPVEVEISNGSRIIYSQQNDPNSLENLQNANYSYFDLANWKANDEIEITRDSALSSLYFTFTTLPMEGNKIKYRITDNFGNVKNIVHIYGQKGEVVGGEGNTYKTLISDETTDFKTETYHVSSRSLTYTFSSALHKVTVEKWNGFAWIKANAGTDYISSGIDRVTLSFTARNQQLVNNKFRLSVSEIGDDESLTFDKYIYFHIYQMLPHLLVKGETASDYQSIMKFSDNYGENISGDIFTDNTPQRVMIGGQAYTITSSGSTFASRVTLTYSDSTNFDYPFKAYVYKEGGAHGSDFVAVTSGEKFSEPGVYYFLFKYDELLEHEYQLYKLEILSSSQAFYRVTNNGVQVEKSGQFYYVGETGFSDYYIVNVNYATSASLVQIVPNNYQQIKVEQVGSPILEDAGSLTEVVTVRYQVFNFDGENAGSAPSGVTPYSRTVFITFIPPTQTPVAEATYSLNSSEQVDILTSSSITAVVDRESSANSIKIRFSSIYGIKSNKISISVLKDGLPLPVEVKAETVNGRVFGYVELDRSGSYQITFTDTAGNKQVFANGTSAASQTLKLVFLKDVSFSMTFTDADGKEQTTDPVQKGVFNGEVKLTILGVNEYYTSQSIGSGAQIISASRNGAEYTGYTYSAEKHEFSFTEPGYYEVSFSATNLSTGIPIKIQNYNFTIVNPSESRYSFEFAPFNGYYIKSIEKDDLGDITKAANGKVPDNLKELFGTVTIDGQEYLRNVVTSALSNVTGEGKYRVTVATAQNLNRDDYNKETQFSFEYWINTKSVPIDVSIKEGESTTKNINVSFNAERVFEAVGQCRVFIGSEIFDVSADTLATLGTVTRAISATGTHFITVRSISGNLLYSYKVVKTEPLNAWAIAAIVIGCVLVIVAIIIIIKVRKRIKVK